MEEVLDVYQRPYDPKRPLVCLEETNRQLILETRPSLEAKPGQPKRIDYEYQRNGVVHLFMMFAPLEAWRHVYMSDQRARTDFAACIKELADVHFPEAEKIVLVMDNLSTPSVGVPYTKRLSRQRPSDWRTSRKFITPPNTAVGSTWPRLKSVCSAAKRCSGTRCQDNFFMNFKG
jgi:hypothetical protein